MTRPASMLLALGFVTACAASSPTTPTPAPTHLLPVRAAASSLPPAAASAPDDSAAPVAGDPRKPRIDVDASGNPKVIIPAGAKPTQRHDFPVENRRLDVFVIDGTLPGCVLPSRCVDRDGSLLPVVVRAVELRSQRVLGELLWQSSTGQLFVTVDPTGRWVAIRETFDVGRLDLTTGKLDVAVSPLRAMISDDDNRVVFTETGGHVCILHGSVAVATLGPPLTTGQANLCFLRWMPAEIDDDERFVARADIATVPVSPGAVFDGDDVKGTTPLVSAWDLAQDGHLVAHLEEIAGDLVLDVAEPGASKSRFRKKVHRLRQADGAYQSLDVSLARGLVRVVGYDAAPGPASIFDYTFDARSGTLRH